MMTYLGEKIELMKIASNQSADFYSSTKAKPEKEMDDEEEYTMNEVPINAPVEQHAIEYPEEI